MLSGNGRHRRPRQAPAALVTAGMAGAGLAMPLLGATSAQAADTDTWDRVAQCESGGLWSANSGNGYYGGLQLTLESWEDYGGTAYAERPDLASRSQQIAVAEQILADRGPEAWPSCSTGAGLTYDSLEVLPGIDPSNLLPQEPSTEDGSGGTDGGGASGAQEDADADRDVDADADAGRRSGGREAGQEQEHGTADGRTDRSARDSGEGEGGGGEGYRVRPGDSLAEIAEAHGVRGGWVELYEANRETVGDDPDLIRPGQLLDL